MNNILDKDNPFKQTTSTWLVKLIVEYQHIEIFESYFENIALSTSCFEHQATPSFESLPNDKWAFHIYFDHKPDNLLIKEIIDTASDASAINAPEFIVEELEDKDWVSEVQKHFKPFITGNFYVYNSSFSADIPKDKHGIIIDAGRAFGTGEHETTSGCLEAISYLASNHAFSNMLDVGCGTGILAIAMAKIWQGSIIATDIDELAVSIAKENAIINRVLQYIRFHDCNGYDSNEIRNNANFDLITSNILAKPLIEFAPDLAVNLKPSGFAILSGLLAYQENDVLNAHILQGLKLDNIIRKNDWSVLILIKN